MGVDVRGDPAAALLEVLDPEQNNSFVDHYIDVPFDLSQVTFIATANERAGIPDALKDRMEIIDVPGYTRTDKCSIAEQFLVPKQLREHGLTEEQLLFEREGVHAIIDHYTREAGVRNLEREIAAVCRHVAVQLAEGVVVSDVRVTPEHVQNVLGQQRFRPEVAERKFAPGVATGLAVSGAGGDLLFIEATRMPGKGEIQVTGNMRAVMKESAATAVSYVRSRADRLSLDPEWIKTIDLHVHVPRAGVARDAASAGITMFTAVASLLLEIPTRADAAATGEITLRGSVLPVSGIKDKILAAHRAGIRLVVLPARNERDLEEVPEEIRHDLELKLVRHVDEVLEQMLEHLPSDRRRPTRPAGDPTAGEMRP
jgi:ATP-dependent Lon protease